MALEFVHVAHQCESLDVERKRRSSWKSRDFQICVFFGRCEYEKMSHTQWSANVNKVFERVFSIVAQFVGSVRRHSASHVLNECLYRRWDLIKR